jgi:GNAT superfamily N-acetyltransferase
LAASAADWRAVFEIGRGLVACDAMDRIVGTATLWPQGEAFASVGMVIVAPGLQKQGIGRRLLRELLDATASPAFQLNATAEGVRFYETEGFRAVGTICQHQGIARRTGATTGQHVRMPAPADWTKIVELDRAATGLDRSAVLRAILREACCTIASQHGSIAGFAFSRAFGRGSVIGPVIAADQAMAVDLIRPHLHNSPGQFVRLDTPCETGMFPQFLDTSGLIHVDCVVTMLRGHEPQRSDRARICAIINQALG